MHNSVGHAKEADLRCLVFGDDESDAYRVAAAHVESCHECQERLGQWAGVDTWSAELSALLGESSDDSRGGRIDAFDAVRGPRALDFLGPPSHPEMLGRIGRYEVERVIGAGGMGVVLKGFDTELHRPVAIKVLARHLAHSGAARQRFACESRAAAAVVHEHVVAIHNVETGGDVPFLVMHYVAGESLQARVDRDGALKPQEVLRIGIQAAAGLAAAHEQGVIHRDIKPANILLESGVERVLLTDFGLARTVDDAGLTSTGVVAGTPHYMSPEQANGQATDHRTDLYSLGSVLYFMATGRPPFRAERAMGILHRICHDRHRPVYEVNAEAPDALCDIIDRLLEKRPSRRFASALDVKSALTQVLYELQRRASRRRSWPRRLLRRRRTVFALVGLTATSVMTAAAIHQGWWVSDAVRGNSAEQLPTMSGSDRFGAEYAGDARDIKMIEQSLLRLEAESNSSLFQQDPVVPFANEVRSVDQALDRLNHDPLLNSQRRIPTGPNR